MSLPPVYEYEYFDPNASNYTNNDNILYFSPSKYQELYTNTNNATNNANIQNYQQHQQQYNFVKDVTKPYTYHTITNDTYVDGAADANFDYGNYDIDEVDRQGIQSFETSGCVKTYFCGIIGSCVLCMFGCKYI